MVISLKVGEPFGTLVLALSVTTLEVALIVSMMLNGGRDAMALLIVSLAAVVLSAKGISPTLEALLGRVGAPATMLV